MLASTFLLCGLSGCRHQVSHYSDPLVVYPEATQVHWTKFQGTDQLIYEVKVDYPADSVISWISDQLKAKGWQARDEDYWNPGLPTSNVRGWTQFADATVQPQATVDAWVGQWENRLGDIAEYALRYQYPPGDRYTLTVMAVLTPADLAKKAPKNPQQQGQAGTNDVAAAEPFAGCYELKLGRWWPWGFGRDTQYVTPPSRIQLLAERGTKGFEQDGFLIRAIKGTAPGRGGPSYWQVRSSDLIDLIWNDGFSGVTLRLKKRGNELDGRAHPHFDFPTVARTAKATAQRIACADK
jgi:hypothetical protein